MIYCYYFFFFFFFLNVSWKLFNFKDLNSLTEYFISKIINLNLNKNDFNFLSLKFYFNLFNKNHFFKFENNFFNNNQIVLNHQKINFDEFSNLNHQFFFKKKNSNKLIFENKKYYYKLIDFFFMSSFNSKKTLFLNTGFFRLFFFKNSFSVTNVNTIFLRWNHFISFSFNIYFFKLNTLYFSSPLFKKETLSLNWNLNNFFKYTFWKHTYFYFIFKTNKISVKMNYFYKHFSSQQKSIFMIIDPLYHFKNLYFFKKYKFFSIGLSPLSLNPWLLSYPVFSFNGSFLEQTFFIQFLNILQKKSFYLHFIFFKNIWNFFKKSNLMLF